MSTVIPLIQALIVGGFALAGIVITQTWTTRRDYTKRRIDLAEEVLALFYEAEEAIRFIRSPAGWVGEGSSRQRRDNERQEESAALDRAYIVIERYQKYEVTFNALKSKSHRFKATFRGDAHRPFQMIDDVLRKIFIASNILGEYYWQKVQGLPPVGNQFTSQEQLADFLKGMNEQQAVFSAMFEPDTISPVVAEAVGRVEKIADTAAKEYVAGFGEWWNRVNANLDDRFEA